MRGRPLPPMRETVNELLRSRGMAPGEQGLLSDVKTLAAASDVPFRSLPETIDELVELYGMREQLVKKWADGQTDSPERRSLERMSDVSRHLRDVDVKARRSTYECLNLDSIKGRLFFERTLPDVYVVSEDSVRDQSSCDGLSFPKRSTLPRPGLFNALSLEGRCAETLFWFNGDVVTCVARTLASLPTVVARPLGRIRTGDEAAQTSASIQTQIETSSTVVQTHPEVRAATLSTSEPDVDTATVQTQTANVAVNADTQTNAEAPARSTTGATTDRYSEAMAALTRELERARRQTAALRAEIEVQLQTTEPSSVIHSTTATYRDAMATLNHDLSQAQRETELLRATIETRLVVAEEKATHAPSYSANIPCLLLAALLTSLCTSLTLWSSPFCSLSLAETNAFDSAMRLAH